MSENKKQKSPGKGNQKSFASKRTMNPPQGMVPPENAAQEGSNKAFQQHDANRRLGDYEGRGNHARTGNRGHQ